MIFGNNPNEMACFIVYEKALWVVFINNTNAHQLKLTY